MKESSFAPLKIIAQDSEDLHILSACLQDSLIPISGLNYDTPQKCFNLFAHRYQWEVESGSPQRIPSGISIENVESVQFSGFDPKSKEPQDLYLLTIQYKEPYVHMVFSNKAQIRVKVPSLKIKLRDANIPWPSLEPKHTHGKRI